MKFYVYFMDDNMAIDEEQVRNWLMEVDLIREKIYDENANFHYIINFPTTMQWT